MAHIFISYSREDKDFAFKLRDALQGEGFTVWIDEKLVASERWWPTIENNIRTCGAFVVIMSPNGKDSNWIEREILVAEGEKKPIFPVLLAGKVWYRLANIQYEDMRAELVLRSEFIDALQKYVPQFIGHYEPPQLVEEEVDYSILEQPPEVPDALVFDAFQSTETIIEETDPQEEQNYADLVLSFALERLRPLLAIMGVGIAMLVIAVIGIALMAQRLNAPPPTPSGTVALSQTTVPQVAVNPTDTPEPSATASETSQPTLTLTDTQEPSATASETPNPTVTPTDTPEPSETPDFALLTLTYDAEQTLTQAVLFAQATATESANETVTATRWTPTFTPQLTASSEAFLTQRVSATDAQQARNLTATATCWTPTRMPTSTYTPTPTPTDTSVPSSAGASNSNFLKPPVQNWNEKSQFFTPFPTPFLYTPFPTLIPYTPFLYTPFPTPFLYTPFPTPFQIPSYILPPTYGGSSSTIRRTGC